MSEQKKVLRPLTKFPECSSITGLEDRLTHSSRSIPTCSPHRTNPVAYEDATNRRYDSAGVCFFVVDECAIRGGSRATELTKHASASPRVNRSAPHPQSNSRNTEKHV